MKACFLGIAIIVESFFFSVSAQNGNCYTSDTILKLSSAESVLKIDSIKSSYSNRNIYVCHSQSADRNSPGIFFLPKFGAEHPADYLQLISFMVSSGNTVIFPGYKPSRFTREQVKDVINLDSLINDLRPFLSQIDTSRIGFFGHGFGGGLTPKIARQTIFEKKWGIRAAFVYILSPWYMCGITERELSTFPSHVSCLIQTCDGDNINDPRIASNLFKWLGISDTKKVFAIVYSDSKLGCKLVADNNTPLGSESFLGKNDIFDTMAIMRPFDLLAAVSFKNDSLAEKTLFSADPFLEIGYWQDSSRIRPVQLTRDPEKFMSRGPYINSWISPRNPYIERSRFRKARKLYVKHHRDKIRNLANFLIKSKNESKEIENQIDIQENPIDSGYGADGPYSVIQDSIVSPLFEKEYVRLFRPSSEERCWPTVILLHGYSGSDYRYFEPFISHIVSRGFTIVYSPYPQLPFPGSEERVMEKQKIIKTGLETAMPRFISYCDTSRIALVGQSFGAGQIPAITRWAIEEKSCGKEAAFMMITAPWYCFGIDQQQLINFPENVKMQMVVFNDDQTNDHQMAVDIFKTINVTDEEKDFIVFYSDSCEGYAMHADHFVPYGLQNIYGEENLLDYYGMYKLFDAMADYTFYNNKNGKRVALGNGSKEQVFMGEWGKGLTVRELTVTDSPEALHSQFTYFFTWDNPLNPRRSIYGSREPFVKKLQQRADEARNRIKDRREN